VRYTFHKPSVPTPFFPLPTSWGREGRRQEREAGDPGFAFPTGPRAGQVGVRSLTLRPSG